MDGSGNKSPDSTDFFASSKSSDQSEWLKPVLAVMITVILAYFAFIRPVRLQLARMHVQVDHLQHCIDELTGQSESATGATSLLENLSQQADLSTSATTALNGIQQVQQNLIDSASQTDDTQLAIEKLDHLNSQLIATAVSLVTTQPLIDAVDDHQQQLIAVGEQTENAQFISDELLTLNEQLLERGSRVQDANCALEGLIGIRNRLDQQAPDLTLAQQRTETLIALKDKVLAQTENLIEAIETFERTSDLQAQFQTASKSFKEIRTLMAEVVMLRPGAEQAVQNLQPLTELINLRRLSPDEIRRMAQTITKHRAEHIAKRSEELEQPVVESAEAKAEFTSAKPE